MLDFICWKWKPYKGYRSSYGGEQVNVLRNMVRRHYQKPHRFSCITDDATGIDQDIRIIPLWNELKDVPNPSGARRNPSCYRRLKAFSAEAAQFIGPRIVSMDLDVIITGDLSPLVDRTEDFIIWGDTARRTWYNGSFWVLKAGTRTQAWEKFDPKTSPLKAHGAGQFGSDQGWLGYILGPNEKKFGIQEGIYSWRVHLKPAGGNLPRDARVVIFHGLDDPWTVRKKYPWIEEHYR